MMNGQLAGLERRYSRCMQKGRALVTGVLAAFGCGFCAAQSAPSIDRQSGIESDSGIFWVLLSVNARPPAGASLKAEQPARLTAQCTKNPAGKLKFELLADFGGVPELRFVPPWKPATPQDFPPRLQHVQITMEFLGYMKVKPVKRQWVEVDGLSGEWRYLTPGLDSSNMEEIRFYLQYLRALPTLGLTLPGRGVAQWETTAWQEAIHGEPLCAKGAL